MNVESINKESSVIKKILPVLLGFCIVSFLCLSPIRWDNYQFISLALIICFSLIYSIAREKTLRFEIAFSDIPLFIFICFSFLSSFWANNPSLIWSPSFNWLLFFLWGLLFRSTVIDKKIMHNLEIIFLLLFILFFTQIVLFLILRLLPPMSFEGIIYYFGFEATIAKGHLRKLVFDATSAESWNFFFGYNANFVSAYYLMLLPYLLFYVSDFFIIKVLKYISILMLFVILCISNSKGVLIIAITILAFFYLRKYDRQFILKLLFFFFLLFVILSFFISPIILDLFKDDFRISAIIQSIIIFLENPVLGIGAGNWIMGFYNELQSASSLPSTYTTLRLNNHNFYSQLIVELGIVGGVAFFFFLPYRLFTATYKLSELSSFQQASLVSLWGYLGAAFFYQTTNSSDFFFSRIQLLAICSYVILVQNDRKFLLPRLVKLILLLVCTIAFYWFVFQKNKYDTLRELANKNTKQAEMITKLEKIYCPNFSTIYDYQKPIAYEIALLYQKRGKSTKAKEYLEKAISDVPFNIIALIDYTRILLHQNDLKEANEYAQLAYSLDKNYYDVYLLMIELAIKNDNFSDVKEYLRFFDQEKVKKYNTSFKWKKIDVDNKLYFSNYIDLFIELDLAQKEQLFELADNDAIKKILIKRELKSIEKKYTKKKAKINEVDSLANLLLPDTILFNQRDSRYAVNNMKILMEGINLSELQEGKTLLLLQNNEYHKKIMTSFLPRARKDQELMRAYFQRSVEIDENLNLNIYDVLSDKQFKQYYSNYLTRKYKNQFETLFDREMLPVTIDNLFYLIIDWKYQDFLNKNDSQFSISDNTLNKNRNTIRKNLEPLLKNGKNIHFKRLFPELGE